MNKMQWLRDYLEKLRALLNLMADRSGSYDGLSSQFSGDGFSDMHFRFDAVPRERFDAWVAAARTGGRALDAGGYAALARPSRKVAPITYATVDPTLFDRILAGKTATTAQVASQTIAANRGATNKGY